MGKYTFQWGGEQDTESTDFFNTLVDTYQRQTLPNYEQQDLENNEEDVDTEDNQNADYEELLSKYQELEAKLADYSSSIQEQLPNMHDYGDSFLNFLFSDDGNNEPIDWSNVRPATQVAKTTQTSNKGFRTFNSYQEGKDALENQLKLYQTGKTRNPVKPSSSLLEAMSVYAPASDNNNPVKYAEFIAKKLGVSTLTPINQIDTKQWANAIEIMEGNTKGNNPGNLRPAKQYGGDIPNPGYKMDEPTIYDALKTAKHLKINKDGTFKGLIPLEDYNDDVMSDAIKVKKVTRKGEFFIKVRGKLTKQEMPQTPTSEFPILQKGGKYKFAGTPQEQRIGLNDNNYNEMMFPMKGMNTFRGLDNQQPVLLQDEMGTTKILTHPLQTSKLFGRVKEKRI